MVIAILALAAVAGGGWVLMDALDVTLPWDRDSVRRTAGTTGAITTQNTSGRTGAYYLPEGYRDRSLPLMVAFHGTGGSGKSMVGAFGPLADEHAFIIVAPDSGVSPGGLVTWQVGDRSNEITGDCSICSSESNSAPADRSTPRRLANRMAISSWEPNNKTDRPRVITSPCLRSQSCTVSPLTLVPLVLSRSVSTSRSPSSCIFR